MSFQEDIKAIEANHPSLTFIDLSQHKINAAEFKLLLKALSQNHCLEHIKLRNGQIWQPKAFLTTLAQHPRLSHIVFSDLRDYEFTSGLPSHRKWRGLDEEYTSLCDKLTQNVAHKGAPPMDADIKVEHDDHIPKEIDVSSRKMNKAQFMEFLNELSNDHEVSILHIRQGQIWDARAFLTMLSHHPSIEMVQLTDINHALNDGLPKHKKWLTLGDLFTQARARMAHKENVVPEKAPKAASSSAGDEYDKQAAEQLHAALERQKIENEALRRALDERNQEVTALRKGIRALEEENAQLSTSIDSDPIVRKGKSSRESFTHPKRTAPLPPKSAALKRPNRTAPPPPAPTPPPVTRKKTSANPHLGEMPSGIRRTTGGLSDMIRQRAEHKAKASSSSAAAASSNSKIDQAYQAFMPTENAASELGGILASAMKSRRQAMKSKDRNEKVLTLYKVWLESGRGFETLSEDLDARIATVTKAEDAKEKAIPNKEIQQFKKIKKHLTALFDKQRCKDILEDIELTLDEKRQELEEAKADDDDWGRDEDAIQSLERECREHKELITQLRDHSERLNHAPSMGKK